MTRFGYLRPRPSDFVIRIRNGEIVSQKQGSGFFCLPWHQYCIIPSEVSTITFSADQITKENQGIQVDGFAIWKITQPDKAYLYFAFDVPSEAIVKIDQHLKEVVISAIRHQVASMKIEEVLRKRGTIILQLKQELSYITERWGLEIETIEIKNVLIMSKQLFSNMQATYRDAIRLESELSALKVEQEIAENRLEQQEKIALREQEFQHQEQERKADTDARTLQQKARIELLRMQQELAVFRQDQDTQRQRSALELETLEAEQPLNAARAAAETERKRHEIELAEADLRLVAERIAATNTEDATHILYGKLPEIAAALDINEVNLSPDVLERLLSGLAKLARPGPAPDD